MKNPVTGSRLSIPTFLLTSAAFSLILGVSFSPSVMSGGVSGATALAAISPWWVQAISQQLVGTRPFESACLRYCSESSVPSFQESSLCSGG